VGGLIASTLWFRGIGKLPVGASAPLVLLSPMVAAVIGVALGESWSLPQTCGFALALAALLAAQPDPARGGPARGGPAEARTRENRTHDDRTHDDRIREGRTR
jgi:probable blue pigment (indigoidine) exporter